MAFDEKGRYVPDADGTISYGSVATGDPAALLANHDWDWTYGTGIQGWIGRNFTTNTVWFAGPNILGATYHFPHHPGWTYYKTKELPDAAARQASSIAMAAAPTAKSVQDIANQLFSVQQDLQTSLSGIGQAASSAANTAQTTQAAVTAQSSNSGSSSSEQTLLIVLALAVVAFFAFKK